MNNLRTTRGVNQNQGRPASQPTRGQAAKKIAAKRVSPKRVKLMTLLVSICTCIFAIPLAIQGAYDSGSLTGVPTLRIALYDLGILVILSLVVQGIYHLLGSTREQKIIIQVDIVKVFVVVALAIYAIFRGILYLYV